MRELTQTIPDKEQSLYTKETNKQNKDQVWEISVSMSNHDNRRKHMIIMQYELKIH